MCSANKEDVQSNDGHSAASLEQDLMKLANNFVSRGEERLSVLGRRPRPLVVVGSPAFFKPSVHAVNMRGLLLGVEAPKVWEQISACVDSARSLEITRRLSPPGHSFAHAARDDATFASLFSRTSSPNSVSVHAPKFVSVETRAYKSTECEYPEQGWAAGLRESVLQRRIHSPRPENPFNME